MSVGLLTQLSDEPMKYKSSKNRKPIKINFKIFKMTKIIIVYIYNWIFQQQANMAFWKRIEVYNTVQKS